MKNEFGYPLKSFLILSLVFTASFSFGKRSGWGFGDDDSDRMINSKIEGKSKLICDKVFEDFSASKVGEFPKGWRTKYDHNAEEAKKDKIYSVTKDKEKGNVLKASYGTHTITILKSLEGWDLQEYSGLQWDWKATKLPKGADESDTDKNDSAASVYIVWNVGFPMKAKSLRFSWSTTQPVNTFIQRRVKHDNITVLESGSKNLNKWQTETVNIRELYNKHILLSQKYKDPYVIALTTDADNTESNAEAYYTNFKLCREVSE